MNLKKIISAAAAALCLFSAVPAAVYGVGSLQAEEQLSDGTFYYELVNGSYTITSCNPEAVFEELPEPTAHIFQNLLFPILLRK